MKKKDAETVEKKKRGEKGFSGQEEKEKER